MTADVSEAADADLYVFAVPSKHLRSLLTEVAETLRHGVPAVSVIKGSNRTRLRGQARSFLMCWGRGRLPV